MNMKLIKSLLIICLGTIVFFTSCKNEDIDFPNYGVTTAYFAYQYPVRTIVLGEDEYDTTLDNQHKCKIFATMGGVYSNNKKITIDIDIDNSLCDNLYYEDGSLVKPMPSDYYALASSQIHLDKKLRDGVEVQLTDAFFKDPDALKNTYVIPLIMTKATNVDRILSGTLLTEGTNPSKCDATGWNILPQDYVLYCVKYINKWHGNFLRRGVDVITENGVTTTNVRHKEYVEYDEVCSTSTKSLESTIFPVSTTISVIGDDGKPTLKTLTCDLILDFDSNEACVISSGTEGYTASGNGVFKEKGEKNSWGNKDRDALYLEYNIDFGVKQYSTKDTLVAQSRGVSLETFVPLYKN